MSKRSRRNVILFLFFGTFTLLMCRCYDDKLGTVKLPNGWSCRAYSDIDFTGGNGFECQCPRVGHSIDVPDLSKLQQPPLAQACGVNIPSPTATLPSPTVTETLSVTETANALQTPTITLTPAPVLPLLTGDMTACGNYGTPSQPVWWVNLRFAQPVQDITGRNLEVTIGGLPSTCGINQGNTSLLSCFAAQGVTYPAGVVVKLDGVEVNNFTINPNSFLCTPPTPTKSNSGSAPTGTVVPTPL